MNKRPLRTDIRVRQCLEAIIAACLSGESLQVIGAKLGCFDDACDRYIGERSIEVWRQQAMKWVGYRILEDVSKALREASEITSDVP